MSFDEILREIREAYRIISDDTLCVFGCKFVVVEGPRTYWERYSAPNGICSHCGKTRYKMLVSRK